MIFLSALFLDQIKLGCLQRENGHLVEQTFGHLPAIDSGCLQDLYLGSVLLALSQKPSGRLRENPANQSSFIHLLKKVKYFICILKCHVTDIRKLCKCVIKLFKY